MSVVNTSPHTGAYLAEFERLAAARAAGEPAWLRTLRGRGIEHFASVGFPTTRDEEWKFTSVAPIAERAFSAATGDAGAVTAAQVADWAAVEGGYRLVMVDGVCAPALSGGTLPPGVRVSSLRALLSDAADGVTAGGEAQVGRLAPADRYAFTSLNTAFFQDAAVVTVARNAIVEAPISILFVATGSSADGGKAPITHPRLIIVAGDNSQAHVVETYVSASGGAYFTNAVTEVVAGAGAVIDHYKVQRESLAAFHIGSMYVQAGRDSAVTSHSIALGGALVRNDVMAVLGGEGGDCTLNGLYVTDGRRLIDNHTTIDHATPHCTSHELYKGILGGHSRAVFNGKIIVRPDAQKTDAKQTNKALLLSDDARINTKPQLEIFANDVKCTHGATVGQLDEDALFYLRARGLDRRQARDLLIHAFAGDVLNRMKVGSLREALERELQAALPADTVAGGESAARR
jgi:Fe-S cluster assembly protein SufD